MSHKKQSLQLREGRDAMQIRPIAITQNVFEYAPGSLLFEAGKTKILCAVSMQHQVPPFLKGKKDGWLTCEYAMLPMATHTRTQRESNATQKNGRSVEISRFLGRVLRTVVDTSVFPDRTIIVDCDVLQADGSTRVSCVTAASIALLYAQNYWLSEGIINKNILKEPLYGISVGIVRNMLLLDLDYREDSEAQSDFNIVLTESGKLVEILGGSEKEPISLESFSEIQNAAIIGVDLLKKEIQNLVLQTSGLQTSVSQTPGLQVLPSNNNNATHNNASHVSTSEQLECQKTKKVPLFSIQNRLFNNNMP